MSKFIIFERIQGAEGESGEAFMKRINKFFSNPGFFIKQVFSENGGWEIIVWYYDNSEE